jgi:hypothetical protein
VLVDDVSRLSLVNLVADTVVGTDDGDELVGQVILHLVVVVHHDTRANRQRRNRQHRAEHPLGASEDWVETEPCSPRW